MDLKRGSSLMKFFTFKVLMLMMACTLGSSLSFAGQFKSLDFLNSISGSKTVSGQHNDRKPYNDQTGEYTADPSYYTDKIFNTTGKYPALWGGDFEFDKPRVDTRQDMIDEAKAQWDKGAIISLMWHSCSPAVPAPCEWETGVQKAKLSDSQWNDLTTEGGYLNGIWKSRVDVIAAYLQQLEDHGVEVLFRPYHEMNHPKSFWWAGRLGSNGSAKLFRMIHDYFTNVKGLTNLIWVWDVQDFPNLANDVNSYNPGEQYWDIAALDVYGDYTTSKYQAMVGIPGNDPIALGEIGKHPTAQRLQNEPLWTFFMGWADWTFNPQLNSTQELKDIYAASNVITLDEMPGWSGTPPLPPTGDENIAKGKPVTVSSTEANYGNEARFAVDGNNATRWSSVYSDPEWIYVDLGEPYDINRVKINWEAAYSTAYKVQVTNNANDANSWNPIYTTSTGNGGIDDLTGLTGSGRYLRVHGTKRSLQYGHSIWELEVYGKKSGTTPPNPDPDPTPVPCEGPIAKSDDGNGPANTVDNNLGTRWSANGDGQWIYYCVGDNKIISGANIAFYKGNVRSALFDLEISNDAQNWDPISPGHISSGNSLDLESFTFPGKKARYIRYLGHGNSANSWNSITEFSAITDAGETPPTPPTPPNGDLVWKKANLTQYESYPDPGSEECVKYNGCKWAGWFAFLEHKQPENWVVANNIAAVHFKDADEYKLKTLRLRQGAKQIDVKVYDMCADTDCDGCCTANATENGLNFLIDIEKYTVQRFGSGSGIVEWSCLDCQ